MQNNVSVLGAGHMGGAVVQGWLAAGQYTPQHVYISGGSSGRAQQLANKLGCQYCTSNIEAAKASNILILSVPAVKAAEVLREIQPALTRQHLIISLTASFTVADALAILGQDAHYVRALPNIPVEVCQGMTVAHFAPAVTEDDKNTVQMLFTCLGRYEEMPENLLGISNVISGCTPALVALFAEALADAGVYYGLPRAQAYTLSQQGILGAMQILLQKNQLPTQLKDAVSSPGGLTIRGVAKLEEHGLRGAVIDSIRSIQEK